MDPNDIENKFLQVTKVLGLIVNAVKEGQEKSVLEPLSKDIVMGLYDIKQTIKEIELARPKHLLVQQEIAELEKKIAKQKVLFARIEKFTEV